MSLRRTALGTQQRAFSRARLWKGDSPFFKTTQRGADWEFIDGTPSPRTAAEATVERNLRMYMESIIDACASVEEMADKNQLPLRPGTDRIRRFDPLCPLCMYYLVLCVRSVSNGIIIIKQTYL